MTDLQEIEVNGRWPLILPRHRAERPEWPWWEATRIAAMHHFLEPGELIYDVGAEEGDMPALWATWGLDVVLIEPNPKVWPCIRLTWEANDLKPYGWWVGFLADQGWTVADDEYQDRLGTQTGWPGCAYGELIPAHGFQHLGEHRSVTPALKLDTLAGMIGPPQAITMDVEGAELKVLQGARQTLEQHRPKVFVSVHPNIMATLYQQEDALLYRFMEELDYERTYLATDHEVHEMFLPK